jgi:hypothetical protein
MLDMLSVCSHTCQTLKGEEKRHKLSINTSCFLSLLFFCLCFSLFSVWPEAISVLSPEVLCVFSFKRAQLATIVFILSLFVHTLM